MSDGNAYPPTSPYTAGDRIRISLGDGDTIVATVSTVIPTPSLDPQQRWRILYRVDDTTTWDLPVHCGDDGHGEFCEPANVDEAADNA